MSATAETAEALLPAPRLCRRMLRRLLYGRDVNRATKARGS